MSDRMICPLNITLFPSGNFECENPARMNCLREECAWWIPGGEGACAVRVIAEVQLEARGYVRPAPGEGD